MYHSSEPTVVDCTHSYPCTYDAPPNGRPRHVHSTYKGFTITMHVDPITRAERYDVLDPTTMNHRASAPSLQHARILVTDLIRSRANH